MNFFALSNSRTVFIKSLLVLSIVFATSSFVSVPSEENKSGVFKFETEVIDYGTINQNSDGARVFTFKNVGKSPIIIADVKTSCGCTVPTKPNKPILPGATGEIKVKYDTKRLGAFSKTITVVSNADNNRKLLKIKGTIVASSASDI